MRYNASTLRNIMSQDNVGMFTLVTLNWNSTRRYTDLGRDISFGGHIYSKDLPLIGLDAPTYSSVVNRDLFRFSVSGIDAGMKSELAQGIVGKNVDFRILFTVDGEPQTQSIDHTFELYSGRVSKADFVNSSEEKVINIECTAPLASLDEIGTLFTTKDGISSLDSTDTCFDAINEGSEETSLKWGKI